MENKESVTPLVSSVAMRVGKMVADELQQSEIFALQLAAVIDRETGVKAIYDSLGLIEVDLTAGDVSAKTRVAFALDRIRAIRKAIA